jgi:hypothetical protein
LKILRSLSRSSDVPLLIAFAVCPLIFFTDLTRNPYQIQITLLNLSLLLIALQKGVRCFQNPPDRFEWTFPETAFLLFVAWTAVTWLVSWSQHPLFHSSIAHEGLKAWLFLIVTGYAAFQIGQKMGRENSIERLDISSLRLVLFACFWAALWLPFHELRVVESHIWDPYGAFLWALLLIVFTRVLKTGSVSGVIEITLFVCAIAGAYSIMQFFGRDVIWGGLLNPYGGRPISTFGNPNFLASYLVMTLPVALALAINSSRKAESVGFIVLCLLMGTSLLCTSTRSSWVGAASAFVMMGFLCRSSVNRKQAYLTITATVLTLAIIALWLGNHGSSQAVSPLSRIRVVLTAIRTGRGYTAFNQRFLIWRCAWAMVQRSPVFGAGWGCFELFYPFYQGPLLFAPSFNYKTHANNAHNLILEIWSQTGAVGLGLFLWFLVFLFVSAFRGRKCLDADRQVFVAGVLAGCFGMIVDNFFGNVSLFFTAPALLFWWFLGAANGMSHAGISFRIPSQAVTKCLAVFLFAGVLGAGCYVWKRFRADEFYFLGFKSSKEGKIPQAIPNLETSSRLYPFNVDNAYELGNCFAQEARFLQTSGQPELAREKHEKAISAYRLAIAANPGYDEIYFNLAAELAAIGRFEEAFDNLELSLWINPLTQNNYKTLVSLASSLPDRREETVSLLENALILYPDDFDLRNDLGYFQILAGRPLEAVKAFERCIEIAPRFEVARNNLKNVLKQLHQKNH